MYLFSEFCKFYKVAGSNDYAPFDYAHSKQDRFVFSFSKNYTGHL